jgi:DNA-binding NarL/FixJ family response regulator
VLLADDQPPMLAHIVLLLGKTYDIVGTVGDGLCLLESAARLDPDVIVSDITMPGIDGFGAVRSLKRAGCRSRFVFLTVHEDPDFAREAMSLGADAYVLKARMASDLLTAVREALAGRKFVSPTVRSEAGPAR